MGGACASALGGRRACAGIARLAVAPGDAFFTALRRLAAVRGRSAANALAAGFLTGKYRTAEDAAKSARGNTTTPLYLNERGLRIVAALDEAR